MNITIWNDVDQSPDIVPPVKADPPSLWVGRMSWGTGGWYPRELHSRCFRKGISSPAAPYRTSRYPR